MAKNKKKDSKRPKMSEQARKANSNKANGTGHGQPRLRDVKIQAREEKTQYQQLLLFTLNLIYKNLYLLGVTLLRRKLVLRRKFRLLVAKTKGMSYSVGYRIAVKFHYISTRFVRRVVLPFSRIHQIWLRLKPQIQQKRQEGRLPFDEYFVLGQAIGEFLWVIVRTLFNHLAPVLAVMFLVYNIQQKTSQQLGLEVRYEGEIIGYIQNEKEFELAEKQLRSRLIDQNSLHVSMEVPSFTLMEIEEEQLTPVNLLADRLIQTQGSDIELAYGLYVDNVLRGAVTQKDRLLLQLFQLKRKHATGLPNERLEFVKKISVREGLYPVDSIIAMDELQQYMDSYESVDQVYTVQEGDSPTGIASKTGVPYSLIKEMNPGIEEKLVIGQEVKTAVARPTLSVKSIYTTNYEEEIDFKEETTESAQYAKGYRQVTREGEAGLQKVVAEISTVNGIEVDRKILETTVIKEPVSEKVTVGTNNPQTIVSSAPGAASTATSSTGFIWPTNGGYISVGLNGYPGHTGIDIPRPAGTPVYAAAAGRVVVVKRVAYGYGQHVMIDHGNGYQTLYAHNSALYVNVGDYVQQGQVISGIGRTGNSTGNHLHFEVRYGGRYMNPVNYVGYR